VPNGVLGDHSHREHAVAVCAKERRGQGRQTRPPRRAGGDELHDAPALGREIERARRDCRSGRRLNARQRLGIGAERQHLGNQRCERAVVQHDICGAEEDAVERRERQAGTVLDEPDLAGKNARKLWHRLTIAHRSAPSHRPVRKYCARPDRASYLRA